MALADIVFGGAVSFLFGVLAASLNWNIDLYLPIISIIGMGYLFLSRKLEFYKIFLLFLILLFFGAFYYNFYLNLKERSQNIKFNSQINFSGTIPDEAILTDKYLSFSLDLAPPLAGKIRILTNPLATFKYGDVVEVSGRILPPDFNGREPISIFPKLNVIAERHDFWLKENLLIFKNNLINQFGKILSSDEAALLSGITFGSRSNFDTEFKKQMSLSGTTHLVALSGYNISILVLVIAQVFGSFLSRRKTFYLTTVIILLFVLMVGAEASVVRAAIMGFLALLAKEVGRIYSMRNSIVLTAMSMVVIDPTILVYSPGFQLSFASLLGIVYLGPALKNIFKFRDSGFADWRENAITTISAQLAVMPILIQNFGQYSLMAIFANILILGFIPLTMALGFLLSVLNLISFYLGFFVAQLVKILLFYEIAVIKFFAKVSFVLPIKNFWLEEIIYYLIIFFIIHNFSRNEKI